VNQADCSMTIAASSENTECPPWVVSQNWEA